MRDPVTYAGEDVCPRCGDGWPNCCDRKPDGTLYTHTETCGRYAWADNVCERCDHAMRVHSVAVQR